MGAPSTTKRPISSSSARANHPRSPSPLTPYSEPAQPQASSSSSSSKPGPCSSKSAAHTRRFPTHAHAHGYNHTYFPQPIIYTPHELFAISPDWSETVRARLQLLSSPEVLSRSPLEEQPPASPLSGGYLLAGNANTKKRRRSHCIHDLPVHARRIVEEDDYVDHTPTGTTQITTTTMDGGVEVEEDGDDQGKGISMMVEEEDDDERGRSRSRRSSIASFRTRRSERSLSRRAGTKSRRQSEGQRDRASLMAILSTTPLVTPS